MEKEREHMLGMLSPKDLQWLDVPAVGEGAFDKVDLVVGNQTPAWYGRGWGPERVPPGHWLLPYTSTCL